MQAECAGATVRRRTVLGNGFWIIVDVIAQIEAVERRHTDTARTGRDAGVDAGRRRPVGNQPVRTAQSSDESFAVLLEQGQQPDEVVRQRRFPAHALTGRRMIQFKEARMQRLTREMLAATRPWSALAAGGMRKRPP